MTSAISATLLGSVDASASRSIPKPVAGDPAAFAGALTRAQGTQSARLVAPVRTRLDAGQASAALAQAYENVFGEAPRPETLKILTAQWAHETGNGASMFNYNFGGIKGQSPEGLSVAQRTREGWGATEETIVDNFRAYRSAEDGATDYVRLLAKRFPAALDAARAGDPEGFVRGLKARNYFTGNEAAYTRSIVALSGVALPESSTVVAPPRLEAPSVHEVFPGALASAVQPYSAGALSAAQAYQPPPLVDALTMADEISRAALRIARASEQERSG